MADSYDSPERAVDAFLDRYRETLDCLVDGTMFGTGASVGIEESVTLFVPGQSAPNVARLRTHGGAGEIYFAFSHLYEVVAVSGAARRASFAVQTTFYQFAILDYEENEIVVYDWAPTGPSPVRTPHLHVPAAGSIVLKQRAGSPLAQRRTFLGSLHLPTGRIALEDIVVLLIREFAAVPRRSDWDEVLTANREVKEDTRPR